MGRAGGAFWDEAALPQKTSFSSLLWNKIDKIEKNLSWLEDATLRS